MRPYFESMSARAGALLLTAMLVVSAACVETARAAAPHPYTHGLLWKIETAGASPSYVFGTVHLADPRVTHLPQAVREPFDAAASFAMEVKLDAVNMVELAKRMVYTDGRTLPAAIGRPLYDKVASVAPTLGLPAEILPLFRPWAVALLLMLPQTDPEKILDQQLHRMAVAQGKSVHELETVNEQVAVFERLSEDEQVALLRHALEHRGRLAASVERLLEAYLARDLAAMMRMSEEDMGRDPAMKKLGRALMERLLDERNVRMAERMTAHVRRGGAFMAVGALHLYGEQGVLAHLARRGFRVTRIH